MYFIHSIMSERNVPAVSSLHGALLKHKCSLYLIGRDKSLWSLVYFYTLDHLEA